MSLRVDRGGYRPEVLDSLRAMGYELREAQPGGDVEAIEAGRRRMDRGE